VAEVTVSMLEQLGYQTETVGRADAALNVLSGGSFDLVISDAVSQTLQLDELSRTAARMIAEAKQPLDTNVVRLRDLRS
jgi:CheY-like chemotaxis protein